MLKSAFLFLFSFSLALISSGQKVGKSEPNLDSVLAFEWKIWKGNSPEEKNKNLWHLYSWHKQNRNYEKALVALNRMNPETWKKQQEGSNLEIQKGLILFLRGSREAAIQQMLILENSNLGLEDKKILYYILIQSFVDQGDFLISIKNKLAKLAQEIKLENRENLILAYDSLCQRALGIRQKSVSKARRLSMYLPSAGLFYSGNSGTAIKNLGLQMAAAGYLTFNILNQNYFTAATVNLHLLRLFYAGGVNQSGHLVAKSNLEKTRAARSEISKFLAKTFKTI